MKVEKGKIVECTEAELFEYYLTRGWDDIMSFAEYKDKCIKYGTQVIKVEEE